MVLSSMTKIIAANLSLYIHGAGFGGLEDLVDRLVKDTDEMLGIQFSIHGVLQACRIHLQDTENQSRVRKNYATRQWTILSNISCSETYSTFHSKGPVPSPDTVTHDWSTAWTLIDL